MMTTMTAANLSPSIDASSFQRGRRRAPPTTIRTTQTTTRTKSSRVAAKKGGAFLKEFAPEPSPEEKRKREERERVERMERTGGFPELTKTDDDEKVFNCNVMVKTKGFGVTWNGIGTLTVPDGGTKENSTNVARVVCAQRKALLRSNCARLYPKMQKLPMEWAVQPFDDPYADPLDLDMVLEGEHASEMIPGNLQFLKKGRAVGP